MPARSAAAPPAGRARRIRSRRGTPYERAVSISVGSMPAHAVDRVQQDREQAEERDEDDLLAFADRVQQDDRDRQQRRRRHRAPVLDVRHRERRAPSARARAECRARSPRTDGDPEAEQRSARGSARRRSLNCAKSHSVLELARGSSRAAGSTASSACTVQSCQRARGSRTGTAISAPILSDVTRPALIGARHPLRRMPAEHAPLERARGEVDRDAEEARWRARARTAASVSAVRLRDS